MWKCVQFVLGTFLMFVCNINAIKGYPKINRNVKYRDHNKVQADEVPVCGSSAVDNGLRWTMALRHTYVI